MTPPPLAWRLEKSTAPQVTAQGIRSGDAFVLRTDHPFFLGHFEGNPILPGVIQLCWFQEIAGLVEAPCEIRNVKFRAEVRGGDSLKIECRESPPGTHHLRLMRGDTVCSEATIHSSL